MVVFFWILVVVILASSLLVVTLKNVMHSALMLGMALLGVAGLFLLLGADFLAGAQVIVYVSGVLILMLFVVMLTHRLYDRTLAQTNERKLLAFVLCLVIFGMLYQSIVQSGFQGWELKEPETTMHTIGKELLSNYVIPFEVASVLLLSAMVGAILFTRSEPGEGED